MFCRHVFGNISGGFRGISRFFGNFAGPRPREISEALSNGKAENSLRTVKRLFEKCKETSVSECQALLQTFKIHLLRE